MSRSMRAVLAASCLVALVWSGSYVVVSDAVDDSPLAQSGSATGPIDVAATESHQDPLALLEIDALIIGVPGRADPRRSTSSEVMAVDRPVVGDPAATSPPSFTDDSVAATSTEMATDATGARRTTTTARATTTTARVTTTTARATTTTVPVTTTTVLVTTTNSGGGAPAGSVQLRPGDAVANIVAGAPTGTTFWFNAGTYMGLQIVPKANQVFLGASGAILAGNGKANAFRSGNDNVEIRGLVIEGYEPAEKEAAIQPDGGAENWLVADNEIRYNSEVGVQVNGGWQIIGNFIHHNGRYGINGSGSGVLIEGNEISYNATDYGATGASGGTKFVDTFGIVIRGNYAHHNYGNGLWVYIDNVDPVIENNTLTANERNGIFIEISCGGIIRNNYVDGNGTVPKLPNWMGGSSGILVSLTPDVAVYGNTLIGNTKGIGMLNWDHPNVGNVSNCKSELRNLQVYDNSITQNGGAAAGIEAPVQTENVLSNWGNKVYSNIYILSGGAQFRLRGEWVSQQAWTNAGFN